MHGSFRSFGDVALFAGDPDRLLRSLGFWPGGSKETARDNHMEDRSGSRLCEGSKSPKRDENDILDFDFKIECGCDVRA